MTAHAAAHYYLCNPPPAVPNYQKASAPAALTGLSKTCSICKFKYRNLVRCCWTQLCVPHIRSQCRRLSNFCGPWPDFPSNPEPHRINRHGSFSLCDLTTTHRIEKNDPLTVSWVGGDLNPAAVSRAQLNIARGPAHGHHNLRLESDKLTALFGSIYCIDNRKCAKARRGRELW